MWNNWSTPKKLMLLFQLIGANVPAILRTVTGSSPISLPDAVVKDIHSLIQYGKCVQNGTPAPSAPVDIVCNNGTVRMLNLADVEERNCDVGYYINNSGVRTSSPLNFYTLGYVVVKPETTYTMKTSSSLNYFSIMEYDSAQGFLNRTLWGATGSPAGDTITFTTRSDTAYLRFGSNMNGNTLTYADIAAITWMLSEGATAKDYAPFGTLYTDGTDEVLTVRENLITSNLTGYGTYVSPSNSAGNRAYKWLKDLPNGTYQFGVEGDYEIIIQWRDPADNSVPTYTGENLSEWITSGEVTLDKTSGGYGIAVRRTSGTSITPSNFDGTLFCYNVPDAQTASVADLFAVDKFADEQDIVGGSVTHKVGVKVLDGTESWALSDSGSTHRFRGVKPSDCHTPASRAAIVSTHFVYISAGQALGGAFVDASQYWYFIPTDQTIDTADGWKAWLAAQYAAGTPVIVLYPLADEVSESVTPQELHTENGTVMIFAESNVDPVDLSCQYYAESA